MRTAIQAGVRELVAEMDRDCKRLFLVGGSWRAIARIDIDRRDYPLTVLHEYRMSRKALYATIDHIEATPVEELRARTGIGESRMALVPIAAQVLKELLRELKPRDIARFKLWHSRGHAVPADAAGSARPRSLDRSLPICRVERRADARLRSAALRFRQASLHRPQCARQASDQGGLPASRRLVAGSPPTIATRSVSTRSPAPTWAG